MTIITLAQALIPRKVSALPRSRQQNGAVHGQPRHYDGRSIGSRRIQPALLHRARSAGANLRNVDRSTSEAATSGRSREDQEGYRRRAFLQRADFGANALPCLLGGRMAHDKASDRNPPF